MTNRSTHHATFVIERTYAAAPARVEHDTGELLDNLEAALRGEPANA
jgi:hypothetical protein